jgi:hypothetical protein
MNAGGCSVSFRYAEHGPSISDEMEKPFCPATGEEQLVPISVDKLDGVQTSVRILQRDYQPPVLMQAQTICANLLTVQIRMIV